jgi:hypothetical protein
MQTIKVIYPTSSFLFSVTWADKLVMLCKQILAQTVYFGLKNQNLDIAIRSIRNQISITLILEVSHTYFCSFKLVVHIPEIGNKFFPGQRLSIDLESFSYFN